MQSHFLKNIFYIVVLTSFTTALYGLNHIALNLQSSYESITRPLRQNFNEGTNESLEEFYRLINFIYQATDPVDRRTIHMALANALFTMGSTEAHPHSDEQADAYNYATAKLDQMTAEWDIPEAGDDSII